MTNREKAAAVSTLVELKTKLAGLSYTGDGFTLDVVDSVLTDIHRLITRQIEEIQTERPK